MSLKKGFWGFGPQNPKTPNFSLRNNKIKIMLNTDAKGFTIENLAVLNSEYSPNLPKAFPSHLIPKEICGHALAQMLMCTMNSSTNLCARQNKQYYLCKRERDA